MDDQDKGKIALRIACITETKLASVVTVLIEKLQQDEQNRADIYCVLEKVLQQDTGGLERRLLKKIITLASNHMRETEEATNELKVAASNTLVTLARCYFYEVMYELQCHLKSQELPEEFIFITLGNLSSAYGMLKQAIIKALGPMMSLLLHKKEHQNRIFELISWLLEQYKEDIDVFHVIKSLSQLLKVSFEYKIPLPKGKFQAICSALHNQICSQAKPLSTENHAELFDCVVLLARSSPDDLIAFLHSQLEIENEDVRVASLNLLSAIVGADLPETRVKKFRMVKAVKSTLSDQNAKVRKAVLHFIRRLLSSGSVENCAAWDMVAYVFHEFTVSTSKLAIEEESTIQTLCIDILQGLDTSASGMTQVVASSPYEREGCGYAALQLLKALHETIHAAVGAMWVLNIPPLLQYIEGNTENSLDHERWEHMLLQFLRTSLEMIGDSAWSSQISLELSQQMAAYASPSKEKGVISIFAFSAESHLDLTLNALQEFGAAMSKVKISGLMDRLKDYHHGKRGKTRSTLMLTYSNVAVHAPKEQLLSRVEADITGNILHHYRASCRVLGITVANKDMYLKLTLIQNVTEISCAILETRDAREFEFSYKQELLGYMLDFIKKEPLDSLASPVRYKAILAIEHLSKLKPSLTLEGNRELLDECCKSLFPLPPLEKMKEEGETAKDTLHRLSLYMRSLEALGKLMKTLLEEEPTADWFQEMFETQETFNQFGSLIGLIAPYSCDSLATSRQWVIDCISCLLCIQDQSRNLGSAAEDLKCLHEALTVPDPEALFQASSKMARVISKYFPSEQATDFINATLDGMLSASPTCATAAGLWMKIILKECGDAMLDQVPDIVNKIYSCMPNIQEGSLRQFLVEAVCSLAQHHVEAVISSLLTKHLPMDSYTTELWRFLGGDPLLATQVLQVLKDKIKTPTSQEDSLTSETEIDRHFAAAEPLSATCAIFEVVSALESSKAVQELLPELFPILLQQISRTLGQEMPLPRISSRRQFRKGLQHTKGNPCRLSVQALETVLFKAGNERVVRALRKQRTWILLENPKTHHEGVCLLVSVLLRAELITPEILQSLLLWVNSPTENLRVTSTAFLAQLMRDPMLREKKFLKSVLRILEARSHDRNSIVRQMAVRGLGNVVYGAPEKVKKYKKFLLDILIGALRDIFSSEVIGESMKALAKVLKELKEKDIGSSFKDLTQQIRTYFDDEDDALRSMAFVLFGILARLTKKKWKTYFADQVKKSWVTLLLHLQDPNPEISMAKENAELLENLYKNTTMYFHSSWEEIRAAAANLAALQVLQKDPSPTVQLVATEIISDICSGRVIGE
ncbi:maestro heat-like repeat-containing protein family member 2B [Terrapene carolina triunguis]|uniref:maestro heat-like repeat-containing protein family member 2B n=1 Tax=Terrapene triunguis TaxID=2587831 RepID=UPI001156333E|nr:maestro heat-like repeat-containing protein family member 2B [Terrapene carolina triunguis]